VKSSCEHGNKLSGFIKCLEVLSNCSSGGLLIRVQFCEVSYVQFSYEYQYSRRKQTMCQTDETKSKREFNLNSLRCSETMSKERRIFVLGAEIAW
jgi:hypothetical protein